MQEFFDFLFRFNFVIAWVCMVIGFVLDSDKFKQTVYHHQSSRKDLLETTLVSFGVTVIIMLALITSGTQSTSMANFIIVGNTFLLIGSPVRLAIEELINYLSGTNDALINTFVSNLKCDTSFKVPLGIIYKKYFDETRKPVDPAKMAHAVNAFLNLGSSLLVYDKSGVPFSQTIPYSEYDEDDAKIIYPKFIALGDMLYPVKEMPVRPRIPDALRNEHHQIIGGIGHGKTSTLTSLILDDVEQDAAMVVIDSQGDLIENLATRLPQDRVILVSPNCPPAMNPFAITDKSDGGITRSLAMLNYVFSTGGMAMTARQSMVYSYLSRLCMTIPGASIKTFRQMLNLANQEKFAPYISQMSEADQEFFQTYYQPKNNPFNDTREDINTRISGLLQTKMFVSMFGASEMKLDIPRALQDGKIILVNTKSTDTGDASSVIGRLFIAQVMQAVRNRPEHDRKRVYLYVDEFADYADDSKILSDCFSQGRKYNLAMVICFQILKPLSENVRAFIAGCTSIKFAGGVSQDDISYMAKQMDTEPETIKTQPKLTFLAYFKGYGVLPWRTEPGRLKQLPVLRSYADIEAEMRDLYGDLYGDLSGKEPEAQKENEPEGW